MQEWKVLAILQTDIYLYLYRHYVHVCLCRYTPIYTHTHLYTI